MSITPRKQEYDPIVDMLEAGEYETSTELAKAIVKKVAEVLGDRDMYGVAVALPRENGFHVAHGPYWTERQAQAAVNAAEGRGLKAWMAPLFSPNNVIGEEEERSGYCKCGHAKELHHNKWGCCATRRGLGQCPCGVYEKR